MASPLYVIDTDVLSETARPLPNRRVLAWLAEQETIAMSSVSVYELARGIERLAAGKRRRFLEAWLARLLAGAAEVLPFDREAALAAAGLDRDARHRGRPIDARDLFILACAKARGMGIATHNIQHFRGCGVNVYDPFEDLHAL